ncbi:MAG: hypothetical protein SOT28_12630 [Fusicatenibacter sp.]|nr:hypothetical protein [Lachnospiraceae bacterium]MDY2939128.1 hypothetical protein [Fusicatenibacter sp.]
MKKILYTKFSRERREQFQIMTRITEENGVRRVWKLPLRESGRTHLMNLYENYARLQNMYQDPRIEICPCSLTKTEQEIKLEFPYIEGESLEERISHHGKENRFQEMKRDYQLLFDIISSVGEQETFHATDEFYQVFGTPHLPEGLKAAKCSNIDMIPGNLLMDGQKIWVVDYEWVFPFPVPLNFIYARSVFLQEAACALEEEERRELYSIAGIRPEEVLIYYHMEVCFQNYAAGNGENKLNNIQEKLHRRSYPISLWEKEKIFYPLLLEQTAPVKRELYYADSAEQEMHTSIDIEQADPDGMLCLSITGEGAVIKIRSLEGEKNGMREPLAFSHNAELEIIDDYYFLKQPRITFQNQGYQKIYLEYLIYFRGSQITAQFVGFIRQDKQMKDQLEEMRSLYTQSIQREEALKQEKNRISEEKKLLEEELERMRQRKVVRMADAVHRVLKKE